MTTLFSWVALLAAGAGVAAAQRADVLVADFEGPNYGAWTATGTAFGSGPARGTLPNQMPVDGFQGSGLVNSYNGGDDSTGTLTSPPFTIERKYLRFLIGGGGWENKTCLNLLLAGQVVRTATGPNTVPGGSEHLQPAQWDVTDLAGQTVVLQIVDDATGTWGHLNVDQIVQSDARTAAPILRFDLARALRIDQAQTYHEALRPQFHFTSRHGWLNDPNGLVFYQGEYHLFYQHNPYGWNWGNMHWGHAVSRDLVHWHELPIALYPDEHGTMYSGSAVVDWNNTAGFQTGNEPALVAIFTAAGQPFTQCLAFSNDRGRTWTKYHNNPVLGHLAAENRDPKVVWYAPEKKWVMALYLDHNDYALLGSPNLKHWEKLSDFTLPGDAECPNFFEMPLDGDRRKTRWVFYGASGMYVVGNFNGRTFTPQTRPRRLENGNCWYASQVYSDIPAGDGRCILIPWGRLPDGGIFRGMPFNQMMGLPVELTLRTAGAGPELAVDPVRELQSLRWRTREIKPQPLVPGANPIAGIYGELFELEAVIGVGDARTISLDLRAVPVTYDVAARTISCLGCQAALAPHDGKISLHIYVDRASLDIYGGQGSLYMPVAQALAPENQTLRLSCEGGSAEIISLKVHQLKSAWEAAE